MEREQVVGTSSRRRKKRKEWIRESGGEKVEGSDRSDQLERIPHTR